ncbi:MAG: C40 family peptidase [Campylobacterota bacterium]|nr:C40 family peptidase [Campylobacterota bacterium]
MKALFKICCYLLLVLIFTSCASKKRYKPVVKYQQPSGKALKTTLSRTDGKSYRYAAHGPNRFDCSGLTYYSFASMNLWLPRKAIDQSKRGKTVSINELQYGDLIFFDTRKSYRGKVNHVGIYVGNDKFTHASSSKRRVITSSIHKPFYRKRIVVCKRLMPKKAEVKTQQQNLAAFDQNQTIIAAVETVQKEESSTPEPLASTEPIPLPYREQVAEQKSENLF